MSGRKRRLTVDDVVRLAVIGEVRVSDRGDVAFSLSRGDPDSNRVASEIRVLWRDGGETVLSGEKDSTPRWGPGGSLAFMSRRGARDEDPGVGVFLWRRGGEPRRVAWFKHGVSALEWLGDRLVAAVWEPAHSLFDEEGDYSVTDRLPLWFDGRGLVGGLASSIYVLDPESGSKARLASESEIWAMAVCRDKVYYSAPIDWRSPHRHRIVSVSPGGGRQVVAEGFMVSSLLCSEGRLYAVMNKLERGLATHNKLWVLAGDRAECLTCGVLDRNVHLAAGSLDGLPVFAYADSGSVKLAALRDGAVKDLVSEMWVYSAHAGSGLLAFAASTASSPQEVYVLLDGQPKPVSRVNRWLVEEVELYEPRREKIAVGGEEVEGWVMLPRGKGPYPGILYVHGGPKSMYGQRFHPEMQLMVSEGFAVFYANPRGSDGYSEEFADIRGRLGEVDYEQLMAFTDHVLSKYPVDASRLAVSGISYGGYMANVIAARSSRFRAVVSENGIADWVSDYWSSDIGYWFNVDLLGGSPREKLEDYVRASPFYSAGETRASVLIIHSMEDYRCFVDQSLAMHAALALSGSDSTLVVFRKGNHTHAAGAEPRHRSKRYRLKIRWLKEKLGPATSG